MSKEDGRSPKALIKSVFPNWTDFDVFSFGNLLVELCTYVGDVLSFDLDSRASFEKRAERHWG